MTQTKDQSSPEVTDIASIATEAAARAAIASLTRDNGTEGVER